MINKSNFIFHIFSLKEENSIILMKMSNFISFRFHCLSWMIYGKEVVIITNFIFFNPDLNLINCIYEIPRQVFVWAIILRWPSRPVGLLFVNKLIDTWVFCLFVYWFFLVGWVKHCINKTHITYFLYVNNIE